MATSVLQRKQNRIKCQPFVATMTAPFNHRSSLCNSTDAVGCPVGPTNLCLYSVSFFPGKIVAVTLVSIAFVIIMAVLITVSVLFYKKGKSYLLQAQPQKHFKISFTYYVYMYVSVIVENSSRLWAEFDYLLQSQFHVSQSPSFCEFCDNCIIDQLLISIASTFDNN